MRRIALISSILLLAAACDKPGESPVMGTPLTDLSASPTVLFQVFGARTEPRAVPIAIVKDGTLSPITLDATGWRTLDSMVFTAGGRLSVYHRGADIGTALVVRGMWPLDGDALYTLPGCRTVVPQAALQLESNIALDESVEFLGSSQPLLQPAPTRPLPEDALGPGRAVAAAVATTAEIAPEELEHLDFSARWIQTGAGPEGRTLIASYVDPDGGDAGPGAGHTSTVFVLAEDSAGTPITSYRHTGSGESRTVTFHRVVNHADLDGDGVAEILLESWRYAGVPDLVLLKYREGRWRETFRVSMEWCVDKGNDRR
jgi:hypothetical protein